MTNSFLKNTAYGVLDLITLKKGVARKINNRKIRFPAKWSRYYPGEYEPDNYGFLEQQLKPGMHVIDIGAHIGLFSVCSSQLVGPGGKIICFEPTPGTFAVLKNTLRLNHCDNVIALQGAVSSKEGSATFYVSQVEGSNSNSLVRNKSEASSSAFDVKLYTIDSIASGYSLKPSLIKIDVEGAELEVLKGGRHTLTTIKPLIILGLHPPFAGDNILKQIWDLVKEYGYKVIYNDVQIGESDFITQPTLFDVQLIPA